MAEFPLLLKMFRLFIRIYDKKKMFFIFTILLSILPNLSSTYHFISKVSFLRYRIKSVFVKRIVNFFFFIDLQILKKIAKGVSFQPFYTRIFNFMDPNQRFPKFHVSYILMLIKKLSQVKRGRYDKPRLPTHSFRISVFTEICL